MACRCESVLYEAHPSCVTQAFSLKLNFILLPQLCTGEVNIIVQQVPSTGLHMLGSVSACYLVVVFHSTYVLWS